MARFHQAWLHMEKGGTADYNGQTYYVSMDVLLKKPYGRAALFHKDMLKDTWTLNDDEKR